MDKNTKISVAIGVAVIAIFLGVLVISGGDKKEQPIETAPVATTTEDVVISPLTSAVTGLPATAKIPANKTDGLSVVDQLADDHVAFSGVTITEDTWVVVYDDRNGEPSWVIGAGLFFGGVEEGVSPVMRKTEPGKRYYVTLIADNGDRVFDIKADRPAVDAKVVSFIAK